MRRWIPLLLTALLFAGAPALLSANPITWDYATDGSKATLPGNAVVTGDITGNGTTTLKNLTVTGTTNLPAAGISCTSLPTFTGDVVNNTSCVTTIQPGAVTPSKMSNVAGNSLLGNATGSSAAPAAVPVNGCAGALDYTSGTGFGCNAPGAFPGDTSGSGASSGNVGQVIATSTTSFSPTSGTVQNWLSEAVPAGDWLCFANVELSGTGISDAHASINTTSATIADPKMLITPASTTTNFGNEVPMVHYLFSVSTTVYLVAQITFSTETATQAKLSCMRMR